MRQEQYEAHPIWNTLDTASDLLAQVHSTADILAVEDAEPLVAFVADCRAMRETDRLHLVSSTALDGLSNAWEQIATSLQNFLSTGSQQSSVLSTNATSQLEAARKFYLQLPEPFEPHAQKRAATKAANEYRRIFQSSRDKLRHEIEQLSEERDQSRKAHETAVDELNGRISDLKSELTRLLQRVGSDESRLSDALTKSNDAFLSAQSDRQDRFTSWLLGQETAFEKLASPHVDRIRALQEQAEAALAEVDKLRTSVITAANLASGDIIGDQYKETARRDKVAGYIGYGLGAVAAAVGVLVAWFAGGTLGSNLDWPQVILKLGLTTGIGGVVTVAFRFGGQSLSRATAFKRQELELRSLTPFLHDVEQADSAKVAFINAAFGKAWAPERRENSTAPDPALSPDLIKLLQAAVEAASKTQKG